MVLFLHCVAKLLYCNVFIFICIFGFHHGVSFWFRCYSWTCWRQWPNDSCGRRCLSLRFWPRISYGVGLQKNKLNWTERNDRPTSQACMKIATHIRKRKQSLNQNVVRCTLVSWVTGVDISVLGPQISNFKKLGITVGEFKSAVPSLGFTYQITHFVDHLRLCFEFA